MSKFRFETAESVGSAHSSENSFLLISEGLFFGIFNFQNFLNV